MGAEVVLVLIHRLEVQLQPGNKEMVVVELHLLYQKTFQKEHIITIQMLKKKHEL
jgi:hypothetical protein